ncbi:hypothetical protein [Modestobacter sp. SSW1-42]|uniref:hypothetical protein n=1 Tax=Modestobacter sp. SSW1-42 TaxID=596372 RepID=UPI0039861811
MHPLRRPRPLARLSSRVAVLGVVAVLLAGCGEDEAAQRTPGDPVSTQEAEVLSQVLHADREAGGADFEVRAPYAQGAVLTLTGEVDFARSIGRAQAVTTYGDGRPEETRTLFFSQEELYQGDVPGLAEALGGAGLPAATYVRRPVTAANANGTASLLDVLVQMVTRLSAPSADDPGSFGAYTWQGAEQVDGELASVFRSGTGATIAVGAESRLLLRYVTELQDFQVTIDLSDHGEREIPLPADADTVDLTAHPEIAATLGL